jgi:hypothetical protein
VTRPPDDRPRPLLGIGFWVVMILALACVLGGVAVATLGPTLLGPKRDAAAPAQQPGLGKAPPGG